MHYCYITVLWIQGMIEWLLVRGRVQIAVMPTVTAVLLHHSAMERGAECSVDSTG